MKKFLLVPGFIILMTVLVNAQDIDGTVKKAVDGLAAPLNVPMEISIGTISIQGSGTPSAFSRYLMGRINHHAINNALYRVVPITRGPPPVRTGGTLKGSISGSFTLIGGAVEVTLELVSETTGRAIASQSFTVPASTLEEMGINIFPENLATQVEVQERERIFTFPESPVPPAPANPGAPSKAAPASPAVPPQTIPTAAFTIEVWPDSDTAAYFNGDEMKINLLANRDCYFKVYQIDVNRRMQLIYPNQYNRDSRLRANIPRTIPENPVYYTLGAPYGVETILVIASAEPFQNLDSEMVPVEVSREAVSRALEGSRGLDLRVRPVAAANSGSGGSVPEGTVTANFTYSILAPDYADEVLSYRKPVNMPETHQLLKNDIQRQGGSFSGDEQSGTFTLNAIRGSYAATGDTVTLRLRHTASRLPEPQTRGAGGFNFSFDRPRDLDRAVQAVRSGIERKGGSFSGDGRQGSFRASGIAGQYNVADKVHVNIVEKPLVIPNQMIEREVKNYFTGQ
jgi:hypothetical protein